MGNTQRVEKWDILKGILIFLVVFGHVCDYYTSQSRITRSIYLFIYMFHMPLFIFISGLFSKGIVNNLRKEKLFSYIVLYIFAKAYEFACYSLLVGETNFDLFKTSSLPWFMLALFVFAITTHFVKDIDPKYVLITTVFLGCLVGYDSNITDMFAISRIIVYYPFYYLGYIMNTKQIENFCNGKKVLALILLCTIGLFIFVKGDSIYWIRPIVTGRNPYIKLSKYANFGFAIRLFYYIMAFVMGACVIVLTPNKQKHLAKLGQRTLGVYVFHGAILTYLYRGVGVIDITKGVTSRFYLLFVIPISLVLTFVLSMDFVHKVITKISNVKLKKE